MRFLLVHGGLHGAWCWERLIPALNALGHEAEALDLPGHGDRVEEKATLDSYRDAVVARLQPGDIIVGHSMGGHVISLAADAVPDQVGSLIYLSAGVPIEGKSMVEASPLGDLGIDRFTKTVQTEANGDCFAMTELEGAATYFFHDCDPELQAWAFERLTPQPLLPVTTPISIPNFWASSIPRHFIFTTDDRSHPPSFDNQFMRRLGLSTCVAIDASHSPFLSRPAETAQLLEFCARGGI